MNIIDAVKLMKSNKNCECICWGIQYRVHNDYLEYLSQEGHWKRSLVPYNLIEQDFVVVEEPKFNLSAKITMADMRGTDTDYERSSVCRVEDIKESINRIKKGLKELNYHQDCIDEVTELIDEVTGPRFKDQ